MRRFPPDLVRELATWNEGVQRARHDYRRWPTSDWCEWGDITRTKHPCWNEGTPLVLDTGTVTICGGHKGEVRKRRRKARSRRRGDGS